MPSGTASLVVEITEGAFPEFSDPDLYIAQGTSVGTSSGQYDCRDIYYPGRCVIENPTAGTFSIMLEAPGSYSGVQLAVSATVPSFDLAANGVTITCSAADVGETGVVGGVTYTKRSKAQIDALVDAENYASLATTCTSSVTDMSFVFEDAGAFNQDISS